MMLRNGNVAAPDVKNLQRCRKLRDKEFSKKRYERKDGCGDGEHVFIDELEPCQNYYCRINVCNVEVL